MGGKKDFMKVKSLEIRYVCLVMFIMLRMEGYFRVFLGMFIFIFFGTVFGINKFFIEKLIKFNIYGK